MTAFPNAVAPTVAVMLLLGACDAVPVESPGETADTTYTTRDAVARRPPAVLAAPRVERAAERGDDLPEAFPDGFPLPEDAEIVSVTEHTDGQRKDASVLLRAPVAFDDLVRFYEKALLEADLVITRRDASHVDGESSAFMHVEGGGGVAGALAFSDESDAVSLQITMGRTPSTTAGDDNEREDAS